MTVLAVSTSSPRVSVALWGDVRAGFQAMAPRAASEVALKGIQRCLEQAGRSLADVDGFVADLGPGSFTGVKVGVTLVKTLAWAQGKPCAGVSAHDLFPAESPSALRIKKDQWVCRDLSGLVTVHDGGFPAGHQGDPDRGEYPDAALAETRPILWGSPLVLLPDYVLAPSISKAKRPHIMGPVNP
jgi:hypothetical protein